MNTCGNFFRFVFFKSWHALLKGDAKESPFNQPSRIQLHVNSNSFSRFAWSRNNSYNNDTFSLVPSVKNFAVTASAETGCVWGGGDCSSSAPLTRVFLHRPEDDDFDMEEELRKLNPQRHQRQLELEPRSRRGMVVDPRVSVIHEGNGGNGDSEEFDSDGPILYRDDDDEDDEDIPTSEFYF